MDKYTTGGVLNLNLIFPNSILIPTNDDKPANAETVRSAFRALSDRTRQNQNYISWRRIAASVRCEDGVNIHIEALSGCPIYDSVADQWFLFRGPTPDTDLTLTPGVVAINTWFFLYAQQTAGVLQFALSTTPPDRLLTSKNNDVVFRYVCTVRSDNVGAIIPFRYVNGHFCYEGRQQVGGFTAPVSFADPVSIIDASSRVPPHARLVRLVINANNFSLPGSIDNLTIRRYLGTATWNFQMSTMNNYYSLDLVLYENQRFQSILTIPTNSQTFYVNGWIET